MTPEELEDTIRTGDLDRCIELIESATEKERRAAYPMVQKWQRAAWSRHLNDGEVSGVELPKGQAALDRVVETSCAALAGTATISELKSLGYRVWHLGEPAWRLLGHRKPEWLQGWAEWVMGENAQSWKYVRTLVRRGSISTPTGDAYTTAMLGHNWPNSALEFLRSDPELLEHEVWRLFEVEGGGEDSLAARDKYSQDDRSWSHALTTLASEGKLSRERLLDTSLEAMERDFAQFRVGWYGHFHEALAPTLEERASRVHRYLSLLASRIPPTVSFALKALALLDKTDRVPGEALVGHIAPALGAREKGTVTLALKLLDRAAKRDEALRAPAAAVACEALMHEKPDVQSAALDLVERHGSAANDELRDLVRARLEDLAPSQRPRAEAWLGAAAPEAPEAPKPTGSVDTGDESLARIAALPEKWRKQAGVDAALAVLQGNNSPLPIVDLTFGQIPVLDPAALLVPVETLDELIDVCASVIENFGPPDEIERMLDGISRLCGKHPEDFDRLTGPLAKRAAKLAGRWNHGDNRYLGWIRLDLPQLVEDWTTGSTPKRGKSTVDMTWFHGHRMLEVAQRAAERTPMQLLAMPTHAGGWLDPQVLVLRARDLQAQSKNPSPFDTIQALLRLAPDHRAEALTAATDLAGELGDAVRYALGGDGIKIGGTRSLWIAASRARAPRTDDTELDTRYPDLGPDGAVVAHCTLDAKRRMFKDRGKEHVSIRSVFTVEPKAPAKLDESRPTVMLHAPIELESKDVEVRKWLATVWPSGREAWFAQGVRVLSDNLDWWEAMWHHRVHLEALLEPDTELGEMGLMLLALGLAAKEPGESGLATDAAIMALRDGRLNGPLLGMMMAELLKVGVDPVPETRAVRPGGLITGSRWAKTLAEVARASTLHADAVHTALQHALVGNPSLRPADLAALLELLHELSVQLGAPVEQPETRTFLESQQGSGKGGKLAKTLLALEAADQSARCREVAQLALEGRIERAERWNAMAG